MCLLEVLQQETRGQSTVVCLRMVTEEAWPRMTEKAAPVEPAAHEQLWRVWPGLGTQQRGRDTVEMGVEVGTEAGVL